MAFCEALNEALAKQGRAEIKHADQGCQFTGSAWITALVESGARISMPLSECLQAAAQKEMADAGSPSPKGLVLSQGRGLLCRVWAPGLSQAIRSERRVLWRRRQCRPHRGSGKTAAQSPGCRPVAWRGR